MHLVLQHKELSDPQSSGLWRLEGMCKSKKSYNNFSLKPMQKKIAP